MKKVTNQKTYICLDGKNYNIMFPRQTSHHKTQIAQLYHFLSDSSIQSKQK